VTTHLLIESKFLKYPRLFYFIFGKKTSEYSMGDQPP